MKISNKNIRVSVQGTILAGLVAQLETPTSCSNKQTNKQVKTRVCDSVSPQLLCHFTGVSLSRHSANKKNGNSLFLLTKNFKRAIGRVIESRSYFWYFILMNISLKTKRTLLVSSGINHKSSAHSFPTVRQFFPMLTAAMLLGAAPINHLKFSGLWYMQFRMNYCIFFCRYMRYTVRLLLTNSLTWKHLLSLIKVILA